MIRPTLGRMVHYVEFGQTDKPHVHTPAVVNREAEDGVGYAIGAVSLGIFKTTGYESIAGVPQDPTGQKPGTWHWPEGSREEEAEKAGLS